MRLNCDMDSTFPAHTSMRTSDLHQERKSTRYLEVNPEHLAQFLNGIGLSGQAGLALQLKDLGLDQDAIADLLWNRRTNGTKTGNHPQWEMHSLRAAG